MQTAVPEVLDLSQRNARPRGGCTASTIRSTAEYGTRCLLARRLVEQGVRFVQVFMSGQPWDTHSEERREPAQPLCARPISRRPRWWPI